MRNCFGIFISICFWGIGFANEACWECHDDPKTPEQIKEMQERYVHVDPKTFALSVHGEMECIECHLDLEDFEDEHDEALEKVDCYECHDDVQADYEQSNHFKGEHHGIKGALCIDCHGIHDILSMEDPNSKTNPSNLAETCGSCHSKPEVISLFGQRDLDRVALYNNSVHGQDMTMGMGEEKKTASCANCHGAHRIVSPVNPDSPLNVLNIAGTCGKCHEKEMAAYQDSIHWASLKHGHYEAPNCTDCHGEHRIQSVDSVEETGRARLKSAELQATKLCASCHASKTLMGRFGLDARRFDSYMKSYHGLAVLKGSDETATCTSCHEVHSIKSSKNPEATTHPDQLKNTCGECHEDASAKFVAIDMHPVDQRGRNPIAYSVRIAYVFLIIAVIGGMLLHNLVILFYYIRKRRKSDKEGPQYQRFQPFEVYQHFFMILSFGILVITGFALKYPDSSWFLLLQYIGLDESLRSLIHRGAAIVMVIVSIVQMCYLVFFSKGRRDVAALIPTWGDFKAFIANMKYHLGFSKEHPHYGRFDYTEKMEYLALIWGIMLMSLTGFILWFPEFFFAFLPSWVFETAEIVHFYEAWLATLAILIWHWFFVIFHPEKYPVNTTLLDGKITEEDLKRHHPLEYKEIVEKTPENPKK